MMRFGWFRDPDNIVYSDVNEFADHFGRETGVQNFREKLEEFRDNPTKEGILLKGKKRTNREQVKTDINAAVLSGNCVFFCPKMEIIKSENGYK